MGLLLWFLLLHSVKPDATFLRQVHAEQSSRLASTPIGPEPEATVCMKKLQMFLERVWHWRRAQCSQLICGRGQDGLWHGSSPAALRRRCFHSAMCRRGYFHSANTWGKGE